MDYYLKNGQTSEDIFYWVIDLVNNKYKDAKVFCDTYFGDDSEHYKEQISIGLENSMYERIINANYLFDVLLLCANGDSIAYEPAYPKVLRINGSDNFIDEVMKLEQPKHQMTLFFDKNIRLHGQFRTNSFFYDMDKIQKMNCCMDIAKKINATMLISTKENGGRMTQVSADTIPTTCEELIDILIKKDTDTWILVHIGTGMIYTNNFKLTEIEDVILKDIVVAG